MAYRKKMRRGKDRRQFSRTASKTHIRNSNAVAKRGGYRL